MAVLPNDDRRKITNGLMRWWSSRRTAVPGMLKADLRAAINAIDSKIDADTAAYNNALPAAAKDNLTATQKKFIFAVVAMARVSLPFLKRIFEGVE